jgi:hypothetical protein
MPGDSPGLERFDGRCEPGVSAKRRISGGFGRGNGSSVHPAPGRAGRALRSDEGGRTDSRLQAAHALRLDGLFAKMYAEHERVGRPSIAPEKPAAAGDAVWVPTVFRKNRERLPYRLPGQSARPQYLHAPDYRLEHAAPGRLVSGLGIDHLRGSDERAVIADIHRPFRREFPPVARTKHLQGETKNGRTRRPSGMA